MPTINLKEHYPTAYTNDFLVEVSEEIHQLLVELKNEEDAFTQKINRYHVRNPWMTPIFSQSHIFFRLFQHLPRS